MRLSGLVIAQDEERDIARCVRSLDFCDEVVVVDGGSRDDTVGVAERIGARVVINPWPGYAAQRRLALEQSSADFVLVVDADEWVSEELRDSIRRALGSAAPLAGYLLRVQNRFCGRWLRFGGKGHDYHLRLFRRDGASYPERAVHEGAVVEGSVGRLFGPLYHESYADLSEYLRKLDRYSALSAQDRQRQGRRFSPWVAALRLPFAFVWRYFVQLGFLDGFAGYQHAALAAYGDFLKLAKLRELQAPPDRADGR
jgi:glycosyltransferase involved in cell wall biosynthesis